MKKHVTLFFLFLLLSMAIYVELVRYYVRMVYAGAVGLLILFLITNFSRWFSTKNAALFICAFFCFNFSLFISGRFDYDTFLHVTFPFFLAPFIYAGLWACVVSSRNRRALMFSVYGTMIPVLYTIIKTLLAPPDASRIFLANTSGSEEGTQIAIENIIHGVMGYHAIHGLPFLMGGFIFIAKNVKQIKIKFLASALAILCAATVFRSGYGACSVTTAVIFALCIVSPRNRRSMIMTIILTTMIFLIMVKTGLLLSFLQWLQPFVPENGSLFYKIEEVKDLFLDVGGSGYWNIRSSLYRWSWKVFLSHPLFGDVGGGGHSFVIDTFARVGLFGAVPFLIMYCSLFTFIKNALPNGSQWCYLISGWMLLILLAFKADALIVQNLIIFYILPAFLVWREDMFYQASFTLRRTFEMSV